MGKYQNVIQIDKDRFNMKGYGYNTRDIKNLISLAVYKSPSGSANYLHFSAEIPCEM
jgi:hypothetical protein